jgi:hypothetical protein
LNASRGAKNLIYRVVKHREKPRYLDKLSYPPEKYAQLNRASTEGEQMFYGAFDRRTAMFETNLAVGDRFVMSRWHLPEGIQTIALGFSDEVFKLLNSRKKNFINVLADYAILFLFRNKLIQTCKSPMMLDKPCLNEQLPRIN